MASRHRIFAAFMAFLTIIAIFGTSTTTAVDNVHEQTSPLFVGTALLIVAFSYYSHQQPQDIAGIRRGNILAFVRGKYGGLSPAYRKTALFAALFFTALATLPSVCRYGKCPMPYAPRC